MAGGVGGAVYALNVALGHIPSLADKAGKAVRALKKLKAEIKGPTEK
ncbi:hypothetical protein [Streptomyces sp. YIM S03343]